MKKNDLQIIWLMVIVLITGNVVSAQVEDPTSDEAVVIYKNNTFTLYRDSITENSRSAHAYLRGSWPSLVNSNKENIRPFLKKQYPLLESGSSMLDILYRIGIDNLEENIINNDHFRVSPDFPSELFYTRDIAYSSYLGANFMFPDLIKHHLRRCRELRREVGFKCPKNEYIPIEGLPNIIEDSLSGTEFYQKYKTNPYIRRTDDVCWVLGYWAAMQVKSEPGELEWMIDEFNYFDKHFYHWFYDKTDGLYRGQASFIDVGGTGYPAYFKAQESVMIKALSTNCLYAKAFDIMAEACRESEKFEKAAEFETRSTSIKQAIRKEFLLPDKYYAYFKYPNGRLEKKREQLGMAFLVIFDILPADKYSQALDNYPGNDYGEPLLWPFYPTPRVYHNNSIWPFANTLFNLAQFKAHHNKEVILRSLGIMSRHALQGNFNEVMDYKSGGNTELNAREYTWSAAAFLAVVTKMILGIDLQPGKVMFNPFVPKELGSKIKLKDLDVAGTQINLTISGNGQIIDQFMVDGVTQEENSVTLDEKMHRVEVVMTGY